jgi:enoyl-CoA hydratase
MKYTRLLYSKAEGVATIAFNRPEVLNALDIEARRELLHALKAADADATVRVVVLMGVGGRAFSAGADVRVFRDLTPQQALDYSHFVKQAVRRIETLSKPVIAAVRGFALGGGLELALACDLIVAAEDARFGQPELNVGLIPGAGGSQRLPRAIGLRTAKELVYTGRIITAQEAHELGLVNRVVPVKALERAVRELARIIGTKSAVVLRLAKEALNKAVEVPLAEGLRVESEKFAACFGTYDTREGIRAFLEKRPPRFEGR